MANFTSAVSNLSFEETNLDGTTPQTLSPFPYDAGNVCWILVSTALVFLMIPGVGYFYSGMAKSKHALSLIILSCWSLAIVFVQWFLFGYSLVFSRNANFLIGSFDNAFLMGVSTNPSMESDKIPDILFCIYEAMFAAITPALAIGAAAERGRFLPTLVFIFLWTTFVYDFVAAWTWNLSGWSLKMGGLDYAGGTPVHIASGAAAFAYAIMLGHRDRDDNVIVNGEPKPHNMSNVVLGTVMIWFGWFGFNGGSALAASARAIFACVTTTLSACVGGIVWVLLDYRHEKKYSPLAFCCGVVAVTITPASGFVSPASSVVFGVVGATCCNLAMKLKDLIHYDDALDVFAVHGVGGIVGNILTGVFAQKGIAILDGQVIKGGWLDGNWIQVPIQIAGSAAGLVWSFVVTIGLLFIMNKIPGLSLRAEIQMERAGLDRGELGLSCYEYVEEVKQLGTYLESDKQKATDTQNSGNGEQAIVMTEIV